MRSYARGSAPVEPSSGWGATGWPTRAAGWLAVALGVAAMASWIVLPLIGSLLKERFPIMDTLLLPTVGLVATAVAALANSWVLWVVKQRSALNIVTTVLTIGTTLYFGIFVIGEGLSGA